MAGSTGYIGRAVVYELIQRGITTFALIRPQSLEKNANIIQNQLNGAKLIECDVCDPKSVEMAMEICQPSAVICCLASRSGIRRDAFAIDYEASSNFLKAFESLTSPLPPHKKQFVLLSAFCCGKPRLQFQLAKLKLEDEIREASSLNKLHHSIVRPTAFFKSLDGQIENARKNQPIFYFGDGNTAANAIAASDLAKFLVDCALNPESVGMKDQTRDIGGPDVPPITKLEQIELIYKTLGITDNKKKKKISIPIKIFDVIISIFQILESLARGLRQKHFVEKLNDAIELARIVHYYASEPMVAIGPGEVQGNIHLRDHFEEIAKNGGQLGEIDPMTTTSGVLQVFANNEYAK